MVHAQGSVVCRANVLPFNAMSVGNRQWDEVKPPVDPSTNKNIETPTTPVPSSCAGVVRPISTPSDTTSRIQHRYVPCQKFVPNSNSAEERNKTKEVLQPSIPNEEMGPIPQTPFTPIPACTHSNQGHPKAQPYCKTPSYHYRSAPSA